MWLKWLPWRYIVRKVASAHGFLDPIDTLGRLHRFAQPSEVAAPLELLRAGVVFHARGLMNTGAIQHNLDWVWPYWIERQFDPRDEAFIPRAFSITHVNLTHRNWTAVGWPNYDSLPIVDPRGLLTPFWDGWSLDAWILDEEGHALLPSRAADVRQRLDLEHGVAIVTESQQDGMSLTSRADVALDVKQGPVCRLSLAGAARHGGWLAVSLRPANPEGVSFIHDAALLPERRGWLVNDAQRIEFHDPPERTAFSGYRAGDVYSHWQQPDERTSIHCEVGMATAAALFELRPGVSRDLVVNIPQQLGDEPIVATAPPTALQGWPSALEGQCRLSIPDKHMQMLYDAALRTLVLHSPGDVYPGPYTYKRFWFRDAAFILHALLCAGLHDRVERVLDHFPARQNRHGYFLSQEGEWDSNGEALWILERFVAMTGRPPNPAWQRAIGRGAQWIVKKRLPSQPDSPHAGLFPAGFSAEHLGPNDYYYWDDFWGVAGLRSAASLLDQFGDADGAERYAREADDFLAAIERSIYSTADERRQAGVPASPYRRMDAGAIGSLVVGYPLQLWPGDDSRLTETAQWLLENCFVDGAFFQDMIHSGWNPYLTLHVAQVLLRAGDPRHGELLQTVAELASPTGQWPEAIHPRTRGGCMGDGQHVWAAAEWLVMIRNLFVREEGNRLVLGAGVLSQWLEASEPLRFGPAPTRFGDVELTITPHAEHIEVQWHGAWRGAAPRCEVRLGDCEPIVVEGDRGTLTLERAVTR